MKFYSFLLISISLLILVPAYAQEDEISTTLLPYDVPVTGTLDDRTPRIVYEFDGLRGEVVNIGVTVVDGDLDPVLLVLNSEGVPLAQRDDTQGSRDARIEALRIPESERYTVVVGRFGYALGSTSGDYRLTLERVGVSSAPGSALRYGDSIIYNITDTEPQVAYTFLAQQGDIVNVTMRRVSGDLDPYLQIVGNNPADGTAYLLATNDDVTGSQSLDAQIAGLVIPAQGWYGVIASRYGGIAGRSTGAFVLTLEEADNSGLGNTPQTARQLLTGDVIEGELTERNFARYYYFDAAQNDLISVRMSRQGGALDSFIIITDANLNEIITDDDTGGGQNAHIVEFLVPATGRYYILATRFQGEDGTTIGRYRLELQSLGNAFDGVPGDTSRITYGSTVTGYIDDTTPQLMWAFWGTQGDVITASMTRNDGDLDPFLLLLGDTQAQLDSDDDSGTEQNARIERFTLPRTGIYYIVATRYSGTEANVFTRGSFTLVLARRFDN